MFQFERIACISLKRRADRWKQFLGKLPADWPFKEVDRFDAIDGDRLPSPSWWNAGGGAWGCYKSHYNILEQCIQDGIESCLFLEDDAVCGDGFTEKIIRFLGELPADWGMIYLGGQHLHTHQHPPVRVSEHVYIPYNINRTHAFAIRGKQAMTEVYNFLNETRAWHDTHHIDHHLGRFHERRELPIYCPSTWLIGQDEGQSNISGAMCGLRFFPPASEYCLPESPFIAVMGRPDAGAGSVVSILKQLGVDVSHPFAQTIDSDPSHIDSEGDKIDGLRGICESAMPMPGFQLVGWEGTARCRLTEWVGQRLSSANRKGCLAAGYAPQFSAWGELLADSLPYRLKIISVSPPSDHTAGDDANADLSRLDRCRASFLEHTPVPVLTLEAEQLLSDPGACRTRIAEFLGRSNKVTNLDPATFSASVKIRSATQATASNTVKIADPSTYSKFPKVAVLGLYGSGASAVGRVLENLGVSMGRDVCPDYVESGDLSHKLKTWWAEPDLLTSNDSDFRIRELRTWLSETESNRKELPDYQMVGAKHPLLTLCAPELLAAWGADTRFIWSWRPLELAITSLIRRGWFPGKETRVQKTLWESLDAFFATQQHLRIDHASLLSQPKIEVERLIEFLEIEPTFGQVNTAIQSVHNPSKTILF